MSQLFNLVHTLGQNPPLQVMAIAHPLIRIFEMLRGGYLFEYDPDRIIQDPEA